jgi:hypothetical protein
MNDRAKNLHNLKTVIREVIQVEKCEVHDRAILKKLPGFPKDMFVVVEPDGTLALETQNVANVTQHCVKEGCIVFRYSGKMALCSLCGPIIPIEVDADATIANVKIFLANTDWSSFCKHHFDIHAPGPYPKSVKVVHTDSRK